MEVPWRALSLASLSLAGVGIALALRRWRTALRADTFDALDTMQQAVPASQLEPSTFEDPASDDRLLRRVETVLQRRTARVIMVLERLHDGHNYAAVLRTVESLGVQSVYIIAPPKRKDLFRSETTMSRRAEDVALLEREKQRADRRTADDPQPDPTSKRACRRAKRLKRATTYNEDDEALDDEHAYFARKATRFLSVSTFSTTAECLLKLRADGCEVWATDLGQGAQVLTCPCGAQLLMLR